MLITAAAAAVIAVLAVVGAGDADEGGPLQGPGCCQGSGWVVDPGHAVTFSDIELVNTGSDPALIEEVELLGADASLRMPGMLAAEHEGRGYIAGFDDFPPDPDEYAKYGLPALRPLEGYVVRAQPGASYGDGDTHGTQLFIGLEPSAHGEAGFDSVRVHYRAGVRRYVLTVPYAVTFCTPRRDDLDPDSCIGDLPGD